MKVIIATCLLSLIPFTAIAQQLLEKEVICTKWDNSVQLESQTLDLEAGKVFLDSNNFVVVNFYSKKHEIYIFPITIIKNNNQRKECYLYTIMESQNCTIIKKIISISALKYDEAKNDYVDNDLKLVVGECAENLNQHKFSGQSITKAKELSEGTLVKP